MILVAKSKELKMARLNPKKTTVSQGFADAQKLRPT